MIAIHDDLLEVLTAVEIESSTRYSLLGEARDIAEGDPIQTSFAAGPSRLACLLAQDLYDRMYLRVRMASGPRRNDVLARRDMLAALSKANSGRGGWQSGWMVRRVDEGGRVVVVKDEISFWAVPNDVLPSDGDLRPGEQCRVRVAKEFRRRVPGFYVAIGDVDPIDVEHAGPLDRYYWHLSADAAAGLMAHATSSLNAAQIPFRLKVLSDPNSYQRADAGVLYVRRNCDRRIAPIIAELHSTIATGLRVQVPLFTKQIGDGLGYAEDPAGALSFGEHRCQLVATSLWQSFVAGDFDQDARANALKFSFLHVGLDPVRPFLGPGSQGDSDHVSQRVANRVFESTAPAQNKERTFGRPCRTGAMIAPLDAACAIGMSLCQSAWWDQEHLACNWIGRSTGEVTKIGGPIIPAASALGPDFYDGSAGVALFLARLYDVTGEPEFGQVARGAIGRSIRQRERFPIRKISSPLSFFCGDLGVAHVARTVAELIGDCALNTQAEVLLDRLANSINEPHAHDVIGGNAGAIPPLLRLSQAPGLERFRPLAIALGEELCRAAVRRGRGLSWGPNEGTSNPLLSRGPFTGMSHGAAGIGLAVLEAYGATQRTDFLETARGAFSYVDSLFNPERGNWADDQCFEGSSATPQIPTFSTSWCHGAPGISLSYLRAAALDPKHRELYLASARRALATTLSAIDQQLDDERPDASLCHGLSGLGEIVLIASQLLNEPAYRERAAALARILIDRHAVSCDWPSGVPSGGPNPSLMLGLAGIGYWLLRLHDPVTVPPFLLFIP